MKLEQKNLPTLPLGDDAPLRPGDRLYVLGYPGAATFHPLISKESITEPSFTAGTMSARKVSTGGFEVLQTDAAVTHGNSGGPVFDEHGKVVGIATFGSISQGNTELAGFNFIMPATLIKQFVDRSGAHPKESLFSTLYQKGLDQETGGKAKLALATFTQINQMAPGHPYVQQHIANDQSLIASGKGGSSDRSSKTVVYVAIAAAAALLLLGTVLMMRRKGAKVVVPVTGLEPTTYAAPTPTALPPSAGPAAAMSSAPTERITQMAQAATATKVAAPDAFCGGCGSTLDGLPFCRKCGRPAT
jgi:hypothetical protein